MTTCPTCGRPATNDGSDYDGVCVRWPYCQQDADADRAAVRLLLNLF